MLQKSEFLLVFLEPPSNAAKNRLFTGGRRLTFGSTYSGGLVLAGTALTAAL
jgi:hypothetical protein